MRRGDFELTATNMMMGVGSAPRFAPRRRALYATLALTTALAGCGQLPAKRFAPDEQPVVVGSMARRNQTPLEPSFACMAQKLRDAKTPVMSVAVGDVKDYTGKYSVNEGNAITQGGALMVYTALGKLGGSVQLHERFDTRIAELELAYTDRRQLGDGRLHTLEQGKPAVPWMPYFGGSILNSRYYIIGGVTEANWDVSSGGVEAYVNNIGAKGRIYTMNVGVDLRIVDTKTLLVLRTSSVSKQIIGEEVGAGVFRFFGVTLVDVNLGAKRQEPLQLGVRTAIEQGVLELIGAVSGVNAEPCITDPANAASAEVAGSAAREPANGTDGDKANGADKAALAPVDLTAGLAPQNGLAGAPSQIQIAFEFNSLQMSPQATSMVDRIAQDAAQGKQVSFQLIARDTEVLAPMQRNELAKQRVKAVSDALVSRGVAPERISTAWLPDPSDPAVTRDGPGFQVVANVVVGR